MHLESRLQRCICIPRRFSYECFFSCALALEYLIASLALLLALLFSCLTVRADPRVPWRSVSPCRASPRCLAMLDELHTPSSHCTLFSTTISFYVL